VKSTFDLSVIAKPSYRRWKPTYGRLKCVYSPMVTFFGQKTEKVWDLTTLTIYGHGLPLVLRYFGAFPPREAPQ